MKRKTTIRKNRGRRELTVERIVAMPAQLAWEGWTEPKQCCTFACRSRSFRGYYGS